MPEKNAENNFGNLGVYDVANNIATFVIECCSECVEDEIRLSSTSKMLTDRINENQAKSVPDLALAKVSSL